MTQADICLILEGTYPYVTGGVSGWAHGLMLQGAPLCLRVPGRAGWELRLVVQGGLRILEKIGDMDFNALSQRPTLSALDAPLLLWRALRMRRTDR